MIENAINGELSDLHVKIDDAILQRSPKVPACCSACATSA